MTQGTEQKDKAPKKKEEKQPLFASLTVSASPHIHTTESVERIMWTVAALLVPVGLFGIWLYGLPAFWVIALSVGTAVGTEALIQKLTHKKITVGDGSAVVTGLLFAYSMSPTISWFVPVICSFFAIGVVKQAFGGLGNNIWNPAMAARAFSLAAWPTITTALWIGGWGAPEMMNDPNVQNDFLNEKYIQQPSEEFQKVAAITGSTPRKNIRSDMDKARKGQMTDVIPADSTALETLAIIRARNNPGLLNLLVGTRGGSIGETCIPFLLLGGIWLLVKRYINWHLPAAMIGSALFFGWLLPIRLGLGDHSKLLWGAGDILFDCLSGGLILGAFFIATDMVSCPMTKSGQLIFGLGCGFLTAVIRLYAGYPEGVSYSVILMNTATPMIDRYTKPKVFGRRKK